jgi:hypothetical protein
LTTGWPRIVLIRSAINPPDVGTVSIALMREVSRTLRRASFRAFTLVRDHVSRRAFDVGLLEHRAKNNGPV